MSTLVFDINNISQLALQIMQSILAKNEETQKLTEDGLGPLALASAMSDFFMISDSIEGGHNTLDAEQMDEFADYGLDLVDRLASQLRMLEIMDQRETLSRVYASLGVWMARREAVLANLEGIADGFAWLVNGLTEKEDLSEMCMLMDEITDASSAQIKLDEDKSNPMRPWRVINLNTGIAATRALNPELMEQCFEKLGQRLPQDMPGFIADGKRQMMTQNIPDDVLEVMKRYSEKWPMAPAH